MKKKFISMIIMICLLVTMVIPSYAAPQKSNLEDDTQFETLSMCAVDANEIKDLKDEVAEAISLAYGSEFGYVTESDIELSEVYKIYYDTDILVQGLTDKSQILDALKDSTYSYVAYTYINNQKIEVTFAKGLELSEEAKCVLTSNQLQEVKEHVGHWQVISVGIIQEGDIAIDEKLHSCDISEYEDIILVASQSGFYMPIVIGFDNETAEEIIPIYDSSSVVTDSLTPIDERYDFNAVVEKVKMIDDMESISESNSDSLNEMYDPMISEKMYSVYAASVTLNVVRYKQEQSNWCWAASAQMIGRYVTGTKREQSTIVYNIKGSRDNVGATDNEVKRAVQYTIGSGYSAVLMGPLSLDSVSYYIGEKHPTAMIMKWNSGGGHVVVCAGVNSTQGYLIDPWDNVPNKWYTYSALLNGTTIGSGTGRLKYVVKY